jgi:hypothetical protein
MARFALVRGRNGIAAGPTTEPIAPVVASPELLATDFAGTIYAGVHNPSIPHSPLERKSFDIACRRIEQAVAQGKLSLDEPREKPTSEVLDL